MEILIKAAQFILSLSILIVLHEMGHFLPAKLFKTRVEKFYLFFNPWFSLFKKKIGGTEYGIGWLPLGGYVKISGMVDESMDKKAMAEAPKPYEFRAKPAWQRLIIMLGGVTVNALLGIVIFAMVLFTWGEMYLKPQNATYGIVADSIAMSIGLQDGDKILAVGGEPLERFSAFTKELVVDQAQTVSVEREGQQVELQVPSGTIRKINETRVPTIADVRLPAYVDTVLPETPAAEAGLRGGDQFVSVGGQPVEWHHEVVRVLRANKNKPLELQVKRGEDTVALTATVSEEGTLGYANNPEKFLEFSTREYGFFESFPAGLDRATTTFTDYVKQIGLLFSDEIDAAESVGGFITIGSIFPETWDWYRFWTMTAWLSIILAFMNLLPIPALDGGHVMFLLWEIITGREPNQKVLEYAQVAGMILLFGLLIFANGSDVVRLFK